MVIQNPIERCQTGDSCPRFHELASGSTTLERKSLTLPAAVPVTKDDRFRAIKERLTDSVAHALDRPETGSRNEEERSSWPRGPDRVRPMDEGAPRLRLPLTSDRPMIPYGATPGYKPLAVWTLMGNDSTGFSLGAASLRKAGNGRHGPLRIAKVPRNRLQ